MENLRSRLGRDLKEDGFPLSHRLDDYAATINLQKILDTTLLREEAERIIGRLPGVGVRSVPPSYASISRDADSLNSKQRSLLESQPDCSALLHTRNCRKATLSYADSPISRPPGKYSFQRRVTMSEISLEQNNSSGKPGFKRASSMIGAP